MAEIRTIEELEKEARTLVDRLSPQSDSATLVTLSGDLGAGKTAFTKALAKALGIEESVTSPTFVLEKIYALPEGKAFQRLIHIDAYRLGSSAELPALGFDELMNDSANLVVLEWPESVADALAPHLAIRIEADEQVVRTLSYG